MDTSTQATVIIVGGSVAGFTLANALEQLDISYILLERYPKIAPDLGASIAIMPNAGRILDQLGCYGKIHDLIQDGRSNRHMTTVGPDGTMFAPLLEANKTFIERFGYGFIFLQRRQLLEILYNNIRDKSCILTNKHVVRLEHLDGGVRAVTKDGTSYVGQLLVGADGVHSQVRKEMWRLADIEDPAYFSSKEQQGFQIPYRCIFGISSPAPQGFNPTYSGHMQGNEYSFLVSGAPPDGDSTPRMFWFLFAKNHEPDGTLHKEIPRYIDDDMETLAEQFRDKSIWPKVNFGQVWDTRTAATLTALPEIVYSKWHHGRIITIGDAAHKFNPIGGQGGNQAIEDCTVLVNQLLPLLEKHSPVKNRPISDEDIESALDQLPNLRTKRAQETMEQSHQQQKLMAHEGIQSKLLNLFVRYFGTPDSLVDRISSPWLGAPTIHALHRPDRPHTVPFDDERTSKPSRLGLWMLLPSVVIGVATLSHSNLLRAPLFDWIK